MTDDIDTKLEYMRKEIEMLRTAVQYFHDLEHARFLRKAKILKSALFSGSVLLGYIIAMGLDYIL
jgi:hypothetical protein